MEELILSLVKDRKLLSIAEKVLSGERLSFEEGLTLFESSELPVLGLLANYVAEKKNGKFAYFNVNVHITPTNICVGTCKFCAFRKKKGESGAYELTVKEVIEKLKRYSEEVSGLTEVHIVGGLHPDWSYEQFIGIVRTVKEEFPELHIKAYTAEEIKYIAKKGNKSIADTLIDLIEAGLGSLPGGGGEIFSESVRKEICPDKITGDEYLEIHKTAHRLGLKTNATMLFGHVESYVDRVDHLLRLREAQDETGGFQTFIPLAFHPLNTEIPGATYTTGVDELKTIAVSRLILDNFPHIKAYWVMLGEKIAQVALQFGADDIDGTVREEDITQAAGAKAGEFLPKSRLIKLIKEAGKVPVERDTLYNVLKIYS
ncbi:aminofutalosine synthase MqnE [Phorcysia thermohydrogeniphila]|uniref:Aminodeoxyfutalosine synthase n=1 Tax=Phorcysia thermohydrogeniphila TaxID=936138 RepID=A0A4R1GEA1_9BACT|nr:aminofutalosine synthase MqnE [Phorcysia thermohydrogeniphila]TCK06258.1 aminodeoxyfutalosine synthase [Phorcysia thermohydrogeniphila]